MRYPSFLPQPKVEGYSVAEYTRKRVTNVQSGMPRFEKITDNAPMIANVSFSCSSFDYEKWDSWYAYDAEYGTVAFEIDLWVSQGLREHVAYILDEPQITQDGQRVSITCQLLCVKKFRKTKENWESLKVLYESFQTYPSSINLFNQFVEGLMI